MLPPVKGFIENTLLDWEGRIAAVIFLPGCNFRCAYCHAGHLLSAESLETIPIESVLEVLERNRGWTDGVVISGGEPTIHPGLEELIDLIRAAGQPVKLDANGTRPHVLAHLLERGALQSVAMDVKAPLNEAYSTVTRSNCDLDAIAESISLLIESDVEYEFRTTVCPAFLDGDGIEEIAKAIRGAQRYVLQNFRPLHCLEPDLGFVKPYDIETMQGFARRAAKYVHTCFVRGHQAEVATRK